MNNADEIVQELRTYLHMGDSPTGKHWGVIFAKSTAKDAADLIESLQAENKEAWERTAAMQAEIRKLDMQVATMQADLARVTAECDAAVADMMHAATYGKCTICNGSKDECFHEELPCKFEWRGVKGELNA